MISFPHAKINIGLSIVSKRPDGFHDLQTIIYPLPLRDVLEIVPAGENRFTQKGLTIPGIPADNLVIRAYRLLKNNFPGIGPLDIHLYKAIPLGAGLGGGSSDAAEIIRLINRFFNLNISSDDLYRYALEIGSDCPFFMQPYPCFATGRGEILEPIPLDLSAYSILLIHPEIHIETAWAFSKVKSATPVDDLKKCILKPVESWAATIHNDFEKPLFAIHPALQKIKGKLYSAGARYAAMTGSGSTIFGIFEKGALPAVEVENARQTIIS
jgi:4-diphosphocytidyl-2-C-methyl-D-erythritol kinase